MESILKRKVSPDSSHTSTPHIKNPAPKLFTEKSLPLLCSDLIHCTEAKIFQIKHIQSSFFAFLISVRCPLRMIITTHCRRLYETPFSNWDFIDPSFSYIHWKIFKSLLIFSVRKQSCLYNYHDLPTSTVSYQLKGTSHRYQKCKETALNMLNLKDFRFCAVNRITTQKRKTFLCEKVLGLVFWYVL